MAFLSALYKICSWLCIVASFVLGGVTLCVIIADYNQEGRKAGTSVVPGTLMIIYFLLTAILLIFNVL